MLAGLMMAVCCALPALPAGEGTITGVVVNGTSLPTPVADAEVVLRAENEGAWLAIAETTTDREGRFRFEGLPLDTQQVYLPGANYLGVHYPGTRVRVHFLEPEASQRVVVYDTVTEPSPLVAERHEIEISVEGQVATIRETLLVANRTRQSYVGAAPAADLPTTTLHLSIPTTFETVTFEKEFFGRQFRINGQRLETDIPWTPGQREIKFWYRLPLEGRQWQFRRPVDLPTEQVRLTFTSRQQDEVACNLPTAAKPPAGGTTFQSEATLLPPGYVIHLELGSLPLPWTTLARWIAVAALVLLMMATSFYLLRRRRAQRAPAAVTAASPTGRKRRKLLRGRRSSAQDQPL